MNAIHGPPSMLRVRDRTHKVNWPGPGGLIKSPSTPHREPPAGIGLLSSTRSADPGIDHRIEGPVQSSTGRHELHDGKGHQGENGDDRVGPTLENRFARSQPTTAHRQARRWQADRMVSTRRVLSCCSFGIIALALFQRADPTCLCLPLYTFDQRHASVVPVHDE